MPKPGVAIDNEVFIKLWVKAAKHGHGKDWIAAQLHCSKTTIGSKASRMRGAGIKLPNLRQVPMGIDSPHVVGRLNDLIEEELNG